MPKKPWWVRKKERQERQQYEQCMLMCQFEDVVEEEKGRNAIRCVLEPNLGNVSIITGLRIPHDSMRNSQYDKGFCSAECPEGHLQNPLHTHWEGELDRRAYFCPSGWFRYSLNVDHIVTRYPSCRNWERWMTMYHGTSAAAINSIINPMDPGKFKKNDGWCGVAAYFSRSIRYVAFPAYAFVYQGTEFGHPVYYQLALEVRIDPTRKHVKFNRQTLKPKSCPYRIDLNHNDATYQYITALSGANECIDFVGVDDGVLVTGLMVRRLRVHPKELEECQWIPEQAWRDWEHAPKPISLPTSSQMYY